MHSNVQVLRAVASVFFRRMLNQIVMTMSLGYVVLLVLVVLLMATFSIWWALLLAILLPFGMVIAGVGFLLWKASVQLAPRKLSRAEFGRIRTFTDKIIGVLERARTPLPFLALMLARDVFLGQETNLLRATIDDSTSLRQEYMVLQQMFEASSNEPPEVWPED